MNRRRKERGGRFDRFYYYTMSMWRLYLPIDQVLLDTASHSLTASYRHTDLFKSVVNLLSTCHVAVVRSYRHRPGY